MSNTATSIDNATADLIQDLEDLLRLSQRGHNNFNQSTVRLWESELNRLNTSH